MSTLLETSKKRNAHVNGPESDARESEDLERTRERHVEGDGEGEQREINGEDQDTEHVPHQKSSSCRVKSSHVLNVLAIPALYRSEHRQTKDNVENTNHKNGTPEGSRPSDDLSVGLFPPLSPNTTEQASLPLNKVSQEACRAGKEREKEIREKERKKDIKTRRQKVRQSDRQKKVDRKSRTNENNSKSNTSKKYKKCQKRKRNPKKKRDR